MSRLAWTNPEMYAYYARIREHKRIMRAVIQYKKRLRNNGDKEAVK